MQLIAQKNAGLILPEDWVKRVFALGLKYFGVAYREKEGMIVDHYTDIPTWEEFMENLVENKDATCLFYFSKTELSPESQQPFELIKEGDNIRLAMVMEGEYFNHDKPESAHSAEYHCTENIIKPLLTQNLTLAAGDMNKFFDVMRPGQLGSNLINQLSVNRGVSVLFGDNGEVLWIEKENSLGGNVEGGRVSNLLQLKVEDTATTEKPVEKKGFMKKSVERIADVVSLTNKKAAESKSIAEQNAEASKTATALPERAVRPMIKPPSKIKGKSALGNWYDMNCTCRPKGWENGNIEAPANDTWMAANAGKFKPLSEGLQEARERILGSEAKPPEHSQQYQPFLPLIDPKRKTALQSLIDSAAVQAQIGKARTLKVSDLREAPDFAKFTDQMGWQLLDTFRMDRGILKLIGEKDLEALIMLTIEYRDELLNFLVSSADDDKKEDVAPPSEKIAAPAVVERASPEVRKFVQKERIAN